MLTGEALRWLRKLQDWSNLLSRLNNEAFDLHKAYWSRGFNPGGENPITDADLNDPAAPQDITATEVAAGMTACEQLQNFLAGTQTVAADFLSTLAKLRTDL